MYPLLRISQPLIAAPAPQPQPEQVYAGLFGGGPAFGTNLGNLSGSYGTPTGTDQADARLESLLITLPGPAQGRRGGRPRALS